MKAMNKKNFARIVRVMYDLQEYCKSNAACKGCQIGGLFCGECAPLGGGVPISKWGITKDDIKRLEADNV